VRFVDRAIRAIGGWLPVLNFSGGAAIDVGERPLAMLAANIDVDASGLIISYPTFFVITRLKWYALRLTSEPRTFLIEDVTPAVYASLADASVTATLDVFGSAVVGVTVDDTGERVLEYREVGSIAAPLTNAPSCSAVVVTPERFIFALGTDDGARSVQWCDQENPTVWDAAITNQAGQFTLTCQGKLMCGARGRGETLIWTTNELFGAEFIGGDLIYRFVERGSNCGIKSRNAKAVINGRAYWMGHRSFFMYDGFVQPIPCEVADFVFDDATYGIDPANVHRTYAVPCTEFHEIAWHYYALNGSIRQVVYNYLTGVWHLDSLDRVAGIDQGVLRYPIKGASDGALYIHEYQTSMLVAAAEQVPYIESGPIELGDGEQTLHVSEVIPDGKTTTGVSMTFYGNFNPTENETTYGPYTMANPTSVRVDARQVRIKLLEVTKGWRFGTPRLRVTAAGQR
jgi:hypothetical protein